MACLYAHPLGRTIHSAIQATCDGHACVMDIVVVGQCQQNSPSAFGVNGGTGPCQLTPRYGDVWAITCVVLLEMASAQHATHAAAPPPPRPLPHTCTLFGGSIAYVHDRGAKYHLPVPTPVCHPSNCTDQPTACIVLLSQSSTLALSGETGRGWAEERSGGGTRQANGCSVSGEGERSGLGCNWRDGDEDGPVCTVMLMLMACGHGLTSGSKTQHMNI